MGRGAERIKNEGRGRGAGRGGGGCVLERKNETKMCGKGANEVTKLTTTKAKQK